MPTLELLGLKKSFGGKTVVDNISLELLTGEILCLLGPSGCGKTTLLRLIAGVEQIDEGKVIFDGLSLNGIPPQNRGFGLMFQDFALFPHMNVFDNVAFGLRMQRKDKNEIKQRVSMLLSMVTMDGYDKRSVDDLSGGEQQRIALARALAPLPRLLMLDEPLGSLDRSLRDSLQGQIRTILKDLGMTAIYVTHDRDEALAIGDKLAFMEKGGIMQTGTPEKIFKFPANPLVAQTIGLKNILLGTVRNVSDYIEVESGVGTLFLNDCNDNNIQSNDSVMLIIEESGIELSKSANQSFELPNTFDGTLIDKIFRGSHYELRIRIGQSDLLTALVDVAEITSMSPGDKIHAKIDQAAIRVITTS